MAPPAKRTRAFLDDVESGTPSGNANEGVKVVGFADMPGRIAASATALYAKNLVTFLETMINKETKRVIVNPDDELIKATMLTRAGQVVHPAFGGHALALSG
jgi:NAD(P) transhydrogenase subunit alpha